jgi:hypothetical protein
VPAIVSEAKEGDEPVRPIFGLEFHARLSDMLCYLSGAQEGPSLADSQLEFVEGSRYPFFDIGCAFGQS